MIGLAVFILFVATLVSVGYDLGWLTRMRKWFIG